MFEMEGYYLTRDNLSKVIKLKQIGWLGYIYYGGKGTFWV